jgi:hypothetical protein
MGLHEAMRPTIGRGSHEEDYSAGPHAPVNRSEESTWIADVLDDIEENNNVEYARERSYCFYAAKPYGSRAKSRICRGNGIFRDFKSLDPETALVRRKEKLATSATNLQERTRLAIGGCQELTNVHFGGLELKASDFCF